MTKQAPENQKLFVRHSKAAADTMEDTIKDMQSLNGFPIVFK
jgi:hypothetical protein